MHRLLEPVIDTLCFFLVDLAAWWDRRVWQPPRFVCEIEMWMDNWGGPKWRLCRSDGWRYGRYL